MSDITRDLLIRGMAAAKEGEEAEVKEEKKKAKDKEKQEGK